MSCKRKQKRKENTRGCFEIKRIWNLKCKIIPVIIGTTRIVTKVIKKYLKARPGKHSTDSLQKTTTLGTYT
jgi:hypothetical protein